ncbi:MAG: glycosyltransferase family 4 protein [Microbacterium sp.]
MTALSVLWIDHTGAPGGGQLGLGRYLQASSDTKRELVLFDGGSLVDTATEAGVAMTVLGRGRGRLRAVFSGMRARGVIRARRPDLVVANSLRVGNVLALTPRVKGTKRVLYVREDLSRRSLGWRKHTFITRFVLRRFDALLVNSPSTLATIPGGIRRSRPVEVAYPVSGIPPVAPSTADEPRVDAQPFEVISLSRLQPWKGVHVLLDAIRIARNEAPGIPLRIVIAGGGEMSDDVYEAELRRLADATGVETVMNGHIDDVWQPLEHAHVLALCSLSPESFGQVLPQAMSVGPVPIATDQGGPRDVLSDGGGLLVPPDDSHALARAILDLAADRSRWQKESRRARERAADFTDDHTVAALDAALARIRAAL